MKFRELPDPFNSPVEHMRPLHARDKPQPALLFSPRPIISAPNTKDPLVFLTDPVQIVDLALHLPPGALALPGKIMDPHAGAVITGLDHPGDIGVPKKRLSLDPCSVATPNIIAKKALLD